MLFFGRRRFREAAMLIFQVRLSYFDVCASRKDVFFIWEGVNVDIWRFLGMLHVGYRV